PGRHRHHATGGFRRPFRDAPPRSLGHAGGDRGPPDRRMTVPPSEEVAVRVEGLQKRYGDKVAVADVSFEVRRGEIFGLLGPNGSGKTTTVECVQGLRRPDGGDLTVFGLNPTTDTAGVRSVVGSQLQES